MTLNERTYTIKIKRIDVCDLLLACTAVAEESNAKKWSELHDLLKKQLEEQDEKNGYGIFMQ